MGRRGFFRWRRSRRRRSEVGKAGLKWERSVTSRSPTCGGGREDGSVLSSCRLGSKSSDFSHAKNSVGWRYLGGRLLYLSHSLRKRNGDPQSRQSPIESARSRSRAQGTNRRCGTARMHGDELWEFLLSGFQLILVYISTIK